MYSIVAHEESRVMRDRGQIQMQKHWMPSTRIGECYRGRAMPNLVGRVLSIVHVCQQAVTLALMAPVWKSKPWYPTLLVMTVKFPILLPHNEDLILPTHPEGVPEVVPQLAAWLISGSSTKIKKFRKRAQSCSMYHETKSP